MLIVTQTWGQISKMTCPSFPVLMQKQDKLPVWENEEKIELRVKGEGGRVKFDSLPSQIVAAV